MEGEIVLYEVKKEKTEEIEGDVEKWSLKRGKVGIGGKRLGGGGGRMEGGRQGKNEGRNRGGKRRER